MPVSIKNVKEQKENRVNKQIKSAYQPQILVEMEKANVPMCQTATKALEFLVCDWA